MRFLNRTGVYFVLAVAGLVTHSAAAQEEAAEEVAAPEAPLTETITSDSEDLLVPRVGEERSLASWSELYQTSMENEQYRGAIDAAAEMVELAQNNNGDDSELATRAMLALAWAQVGAGDLAPAASSYASVIGMIEHREGIFSEQLIEPLTELGAAYHQGGEAQLALDALLRAQHITHRQKGLFNQDQIPIVDSMTEIYVATGEFSDANRQQNFAFRVVERECDDVEVCKVDGLYKIAKWNVRMGRNAQARKLYRRALEALQVEYGENDLRLVPALHGIAETYEKEGFRRKDGEQALIKAVAIHDNQAFGDSVEHAASLAKLGDWYTLKSNFNDAKTTYERAWNVMVEQGASKEQANAFFALPSELRYIPPRPSENDQSWNPSRIFDKRMVIEFTVASNGKVDDVVVLEASVPRRVQREVREAIKRARYRPRLVDGELVPTPSVKLTQTFDYVRTIPPRSEDPFEQRSRVCPTCIP